MAFANPVSNIIVQSGTDTSLSGLSTVTGVTVTTIGTLIIYNLGTSGLSITGTLTINAGDTASREMLVCGQAGATQAFIDVHVRSGGTLNVGHRTTQGTSAVSSERYFPSIFEKAALDFGEGNTKAFAGQATLGAANSKGFLVVDGGGTLNWYGVINCCGGIGFDGIANDLSSPLPVGNANVNIVDGVWDARQVTERSGVGDQFLYSYTNNLNVDGFTWISNEAAGLGAALIILSQPVSFKRPNPVNTELAFTGSTSSANDLQLIFEDYSGIVGNDNGTDMTSATNNAVNTCVVTFLNSDKGSTLKFNTQDPGVSRILARQHVTGNCVNSAGANRIDAVLATVDKNGAITQAAISAGQFDLGQITVTEWNPPGGTTPPAPTYFSPSNTNDDLWSFYCYSYLGANRNRLNVLLRGAGGTHLEFIVADEPGITETDYNLTLAILAVDTLGVMFDRSRLEKVINVGVPSLPVPIVERSGELSDYGALNIVLDGLAAQPYECTATTLTVNPLATAKVQRVGVTEFTTGAAEAQQIVAAVVNGVIDGDLLFLIVVAAEVPSSTYNTPAGWTQLAANVLTGGTPNSHPGASIYARVASSEPATYTITTSTTFNTGHAGQMIAYRGADTTNIAGIVISSATSATGSPNAPAVTAAVGDVVLEIGLSDTGAQTWVSDSTGYDHIADTATTGGAGAGE